MWMDRTSITWMQWYILNKVQLNLRFNDLLDCMSASNFKVMQMFWRHKILFLKFHINYRRSISEKFSWKEKLCFLTSLFQAPYIAAACLIGKYSEFLWELLTGNYSTENFILCSGNWPRSLWYQSIKPCNFNCWCFQFKG